jgi:hypothetical protein
MRQLLRFSIKHLLLWTAIVALFCVALKNASGAWASSMLALALIVLAASVLLAAFRHGAVRAYWIGFATCGWIYIAVLLYSWSQHSNPFLNPLRSDRLPSSRLSALAYRKTRPWIAWSDRPQQHRFYNVDPLDNGLGAGSSMVVLSSAGPYQDHFVNVAHAFWTLLLAACGGAFARWLYVTGPGRLKTAETGAAERGCEEASR